MLDGGLSRVPQPVDRRAARRPESPRRQPDDQPSSAPQPQPATSHDNGRLQTKRTDKSSKKLPKWLGIIAGVVLVAALAWLAWTNLFGGVAGTINSNRTQAVLLTNGQTYFGNLSVVDSEFFKLTNVFYVQSNEASDEAEEPTSSNMQLVKRGEEVFGPEDAMMISRDQVLYFENIKDDSQVSQLMRDFEAGN